MRRSILFVVVILTTNVRYPLDLGATTYIPYSDEPLSQKPLMDTAQIAVERVRLNNWLVERQGTLTAEQFPMLRERVYLLIDSILKNRQREARTTFNGFERSSLRMLFDWGTYLGVYGSGLVAQQLSEEGDATPMAPLLPTEPVQIHFESQLFIVSCREAHWRVKVPYYFMIWQAARFKAKNNLITDQVIASTAFSKNENVGGQSQATIMFMYSPESDCNQFDRSWLGYLKMDRGNQTNRQLLPHSHNYQQYDQKSSMRMEATLFSDASGCYAIAYSGLDGPYQANRANYLDFVRSIDRGSGRSTK